MIPELRKVAQLNSKYCIEKNGGTIVHVCIGPPPDKVTALCITHCFGRQNLNCYITKIPIKSIFFYGCI